MEARWDDVSTTVEGWGERRQCKIWGGKRAGDTAKWQSNACLECGDPGFNAQHQKQNTLLKELIRRKKSEAASGGSNLGFRL